jgi:hypothetical protein
MLREITHALAPFIWGGVILVMVWLRHKRKMAEIAAERHDGAPRGEPLASAQAEELARLRERVRVLERIATDAERPGSPQSLAAQIDALKD